MTGRKLAEIVGVVESFIGLDTMVIYRQLIMGEERNIFLPPSEENGL